MPPEVPTAFFVKSTTPGVFPGMHQPLGLYAIHIVVRNGHTTLFGLVDNDGDRQIAEMRAREVTGVFSVDNQIVVNKG